MSKDSDAFERIQGSEALQRQILAWLLQTPSDRASTEGERSPTSLAHSGSDLSDRQDVDELDPLDSEALNATPFSLHFSEELPPERGEQPLTSGEIPAVQERFQALLKRRLQTEIKRQPPLFPWEKDTGMWTYEAEGSDRPMAQQVPSKLWATGLLNLNLPPIPETVLAQLLDQCQTLVQSSLREGAKLVRAVEGLFPGQAQTLNQVAELILKSPSLFPTRWGNDEQQRLSPQITADFPSSYEGATPSQQMTLALLAAREIIGTLTLIVSPTQPSLERQWLTPAGLLTLKVTAQISGRSMESVRIEGQIPCGGSLQLRGTGREASAQRTDGGTLGVECFDLQLNHGYTVMVSFDHPEQKPLVFSLEGRG